jgi:uncharacterized protein (TIGR02145 family)
MIYITTYPLTQRINPMRKLLLTTAAVAAAIGLAGCGNDAPDTLVDKRDGRKYQTVIIGGKRWMAENLNYRTQDGSWCYDDKKSNCKKYGRLYDWETAKSVCPSGWRLPHGQEWDSLTQSVIVNEWQHDKDGRISRTGAAKTLKARRDWASGTGFDSYGFSALPGGRRASGGNVCSFYGVNQYGYWWTADEHSGDRAEYRGMDNANSNVDAGGNNKSDGMSVRCLQDGGGKSLDSAERTERIEKLSTYFKDSRDGRIYRAVKIGGKTWMAENLNYQTDSSWCNDNDNSNCDKYGRLYNWNAAKSACPSGWHLPSRKEWNKMVAAAGGKKQLRPTSNDKSDGIFYWYGAGEKLKYTSGWNSNGNGTDDLGFSALPGGSRGKFYGQFQSTGKYGAWWTATRSKEGDAYSRNITFNSNYVSEDEYADTVEGLSARCVRNGGDGGDSDLSEWIRQKREDGERLIDAERKRKEEEERKRKTAELTIEKNTGYFTDTRDGQKYRTINIGNQIWMARNLNYKIPDSSWCYGNADSNCVKYGRLYTWNAANDACPSEWYLPGDEDWRSLAKAVGGAAGIYGKFRTSGRKLKSTSGWNYDVINDKSGDGTDEYGFSALPSGYRLSDELNRNKGEDGRFSGIGNSGVWWMPQLSIEGIGLARNMYIRYDGNDTDEGAEYTSAGYSVRCVSGEMSRAYAPPAAAAEPSWRSGATTVTLSPDGALRVKGVGDMDDYHYRNGHLEWVEYSPYRAGIYAPWLDSDSLITKLIVEDGVTRIGDFAFTELYALKSVTIPASAASIGRFAFERCKNLTSVIISNGVSSIETSAFSMCENLTSVIIPNSVASIGRGAFSWSGLTSITFPTREWGLYIDDWAFAHCAGLTSVTIPSGADYLGDGAFSACTGLMSAVIMTVPMRNEGNSFHNVFEDCFSLTSVTLPDDDEAYYGIGYGMFANCTSLTSITLPKSAERIERRAFKGCKNLTSIISRKRWPPRIDDSTAFSGVNLDNVCLYVPAGRVNAYRAADVWKDIYCVREIPEFPWAKLALGILTALIVSAAALVIIKRLRKSSGNGVV